MSKINIFATDTETNGLNSLRHNAISIAAVMAQREENSTELSNIKTFYTLLNWSELDPDFSISEKTTAVHGLTLKDLQNQPDPIEGYSKTYEFIQNYLNGEKLDVLNGFNVTFDLHMIIQDLIELIRYTDENIEKFYNRENEVLNIHKMLDLFYAQDSGELGAQLSESKNVIDTTSNGMLIIDSINIDRIFQPTDKNGVRNRHNLDDCARRLGLIKNSNAHDALADTVQTVKVLNEQSVRLQNKGINVFTKEFEKRLERKYDYTEALYKKKEIRSYTGRKVG